MFTRLLALFAVVALLAACETAGRSTATPATPAKPVTEGSSGNDNRSVTRQLARVGNVINFDFDSASLTPAATRTLDRQVDFLRKNEDVLVTIEGHADERGTREYNLALGARRAAAARDYLVSRGVAAKRIVTISYGKDRPLATRSNERAWARNRRAATVGR